MDWLTALILGIIQGLTEFLPVSSSGHLELGKVILGVEARESLSFTIVVHGATVLSTIVVFYREIGSLTKGALNRKWNDEKKYILKIIISMLPVGVLGIFFKDTVEQFFTGNVVLVGAMLIVTSFFLASTYLMKPGFKKIPYVDSFIIGLSQALAVLPGISRSGATISTGLLLKNNRDEVTKFSFLMVLLPIIAANTVDLLSSPVDNTNSVGALALIVGFLSAFISGLIACRWMIRIVRKGNLIYFAIYCFIIGVLGIVCSL